MARILRILGLVFIVLVAIGVVTAIAARFADGPIGPFPGGPFRAETSASAPDANAIGALDTVQIEVNPAAPRTRTTWILVHDGTLYVPAGGAVHKRWPGQAEADGRVRLRANGVVYAMQAERVTDRAQIAPLQQALAAKYPVSRDRGAFDDGTWFFRLAPRPATADGAR